MTSRSGRDAVLAMLREESTELFIERMWRGLWLLLVSILVLAPFELWVQPARRWELVGIKAVQLGAILAVFLAIRRRPSWGGCVVLSLALLFEVYITLAATGILVDEVASTPLLFILITVVSATFLPWGAAPQAASGVIATVAMASNALLVTAIPAKFAYSVVAALLTFVASTLVARELERHRLQGRSAQEDVRQSARELRHELQVTGAVAHVSQEVIAALDEPTTLLDRLCGLTTEALGCDASLTFLRDAHERRFAVVAAFGERPDRLARLRHHGIPELALGELLPRLARGEVARIVAASGADVLPLDAATTLCAGLRCGDQVVGILAAVFRDPTRTIADELRVLGGIARIGAMALAHARLLESLGRANAADAEYRAALSQEMASRVDALASLLDPGDRGARRDPEATAARARRLARELQKLVTDTGELTRAETDALHPEPIALAAFWAELGHDCERLPRPHGTTLRWGPAPDPRTVVTDPHKLAAVIRMLVAAMLAHTPEAEVRVDLVADGEAVAAHVTGAGLPARWHADDHATAPAPEDDDPATGWLGFHIVHRLAEQLGGSVAIEADDQRTSTVVVRLSSLQSTSGAGRAA